MNNEIYLKIIRVNSGGKAIGPPEILLFNREKLLKDLPKNSKLNEAITIHYDGHPLHCKVICVMDNIIDSLC